MCFHECIHLDAALHVVLVRICLHSMHERGTWVTQPEGNLQSFLMPLLSFD